MIVPTVTARHHIGRRHFEQPEARTNSGIAAISRMLTSGAASALVRLAAGAPSSAAAALCSGGSSVRSLQTSGSSSSWFAHVPEAPRDPILVCTAAPIA